MSWVHEPLRRRDDCQYDAEAAVKRVGVTGMW